MNREEVLSGNSTLRRWLNSLLAVARPAANRRETASTADARIAEQIRAAYRLQEVGALGAAEDSCRSILAERPAQVEALSLLGDIANRTGRFGEAIAVLREAVRLAPDDLSAHVNLAAALLGSGSAAHAVQVCRRALAIDAHCVHALCNLSIGLLKLGELEDAQRSIERAVELDPAFLPAHTQLGDTLLARNLPQRAARSYREAVRLRPDAANAHDSLGYSLQVMGELSDALPCYEKAIAIDPEYVQAHLNRAALWLLREDYAKGWAEYEWRLRTPEGAALEERFPIPRWDGSSLAGRSILVHAEQGLGDQIMYASCLPQVIAQASRCVIECDPRLAALFRRSFPGATVLEQTERAEGRGLEGLELRIPFGSLPLHLRRSAADFPRHQAYLRADPKRVSAWRTRLERLGAGPKIGLSWRGGVPRTGRAWRSLALEQLLPVLRRRGMTFINLQYGDSEDERRGLERTHGVPIHHWQEAIEDYDETAALVCALDLTISVCTAVVHLCGALGRPAWVMAPIAPEPRYGFSGATMRWYPSVRMFRQSRHGDWDGVIRDIVPALASLERDT